MSEYKFYQRKNKELQTECSWVPGTPAKLISTRTPLEGSSVEISEEEKAASNDAPESCSSEGFCKGGQSNSSGGTGSIPFTQLLTSNNVVSPDSQKSVISVVDKPTVADTQIEDASDSQESANSTTRDILKDTNITENLQKDNNTPESGFFQHGQHNVQEGVVSGKGVETSNKQSEKIPLKRERKQKPKRKKHRPRVVDEGRKAKKVPQPKTPKPVTPKRPSSKETKSSKKRKYVRESGQGNLVSEDIFDDESFPKRRKSSRKTSKTNSDVISEVAEKRSCRRALNFDDESDKSTADAHLLELEFPSMSKKMRSQRRRRLNTFFMPKLTLSREGIPRKGKRSRRPIRRSDLPLLMAPPIRNQLPSLPFEEAQTGEKKAEVLCEPKKIIQTGEEEKEETEVIREPKKIMQTGEEDKEEEPTRIMLFNIFHQMKVTENQRKMESGLVDLELHNSKREGRTPLENESFLFTTKDTGSRKISKEKKISFVIDEGESEEIIALTGQLKQDHNAQGPNSGHGTLVLYQEPSNRKKISGKVKLDPDTLRVWNWLMYIEDSDANKEKIDPEKEDRWRSEREGFQRRIESFTERMNLILGDRSFKPWKGSVVDSVVGVYLTQNVSDFLSSSAYMLLASKFPLKTTSNSTANNMASTEVACEFEGNLYFVTEPEPDRSSELKNRIEHLDSGVEGKYLVEMDEGRVLKNVVEPHTIDGSSNVQLSPAFNTQSDFASPSNSCSPTGYTCSDELPEFKNTTLPQDLHYNGGKISSCEEGQGDMYMTSTGMDYGNQALMSGRINELNGDCGFIPLVDSYDPFGKTSVSPSDHMQQAQDATIMSKETPRGKAPKLKNVEAKKALPQDLHYNGGKISSCEEGQGDMYMTSTGMDYGNQALMSGRINELNGDCGFIPLVDSYDPFGKTAVSPSDHMQQAQDATIMSKETPRRKAPQAHDATIMSKETPRGKAPKLKNVEAKKATPKENKKDNQEQKDWDLFRKMYSNGEPISSDHMDSVDWEAVRLAQQDEVAKVIKDRGQQNVIAGRIQDFLNRLVKVHGSIDLEWLRNAPPDFAKEYLLDIPGLGLKSVECIRLLSLQLAAFPVDTNVARIAVRLGWVPLQALPESIQIHQLEQYPQLDSIQKYLWPRLCNLDQRTLYELHYQLITFGKVFCTMSKPNCGDCPLRGECKHFASKIASSRLPLEGPPGPSERGTVEIHNWFHKRNSAVDVNPIPVTVLEADPLSESGYLTNNCEPIIEEPGSPEPQCREMSPAPDLEDFSSDELEEIPTIRLQEREFKENLQNFMETNNIVLPDSRALVLLTEEAASMPPPKLKSITRLRTEHLVYELPDNHHLLRGFDRREPDDPCPYLLSVWTPGETPDSFEKPIKKCNSGESELCEEQTCHSCNAIREQNVDIVRGTILIPCRTAIKGRFPLNGTYFQVNEVFADHETSGHPIPVPRSTIAHLPMQTAYFGTSATSILRALDVRTIQYCFWRGYICVRGFNRKCQAPRPLARRFHISTSKIGKPSEKWTDE